MSFKCSHVRVHTDKDELCNIKMGKLQQLLYVAGNNYSASDAKNLSKVEFGLHTGHSVSKQT